MSINYDQLQTYMNGLVPERPLELQKMEAYAEEHNFPIIGPASGHFCYQIARLTGAKRIFEMGSGYGYSTYWFAKAVAENSNGSSDGEVHHVVWDDDLSQMARDHLGKLGYGHLVKYHVSEAVGMLRQTDGPFDIIFNDILKYDYPKSIPIIAEKLRPGGVLLIDNMLWGGGIWDESKTDEYTEGVRESTRLLTESDSWISSLVPVYDGLIMAIKR
ncbi:MAG: O-methyltransferase [Chloroflexota bacterium]